MRAPAVACALVVAAAAPSPASAYEYEVRARTLGQAFELPAFRAGGGVTRLTRRRLTQALSLDIHDIGDLAEGRRRRGAARRGPVVRFTSYLRLDHDLGDWTMGTVDWPARSVDPLDAIDAIPELATGAMALDLLYAVLTVEDLGPVDLAVGRQVRYGQLDAWAFDGAALTVDAPGPVALEVAGGLRLRDGSPAAVASRELDGTTGADCREYVEAATPGAGSWRLIDRSRVPGDGPFTADLDDCPQREQAVPTVELAAALDGLRRWHARVAYRRSASRTVGLIGPVDRLDVPDEGLYPGGAALRRWGVDEEHVAAEVAAAVALPGGARLSPWAAARYSLLHGVADQAAAGVRLRRGAHAVEPEVARVVPIFDGDSLFNVFAAGPADDARLAWTWQPRVGRARGLATRATAWLRRYALGAPDDAHALAGGLDVRARWTGARWSGDADAQLDDGWGGGRAGVGLGASWRASPSARYGARASVLALAEDADASPAVLGGVAPGTRWHGAGSAHARWTLMDGVTVSAIVEATSGAVIPLQARALAVLDLQFVPDTSTAAGAPRW